MFHLFFFGWKKQHCFYMKWLSQLYLLFFRRNVLFLSLHKYCLIVDTLTICFVWRLVCLVVLCDVIHCQSYILCCVISYVSYSFVWRVIQGLMMSPLHRNLSNCFMWFYILDISFVFADWPACCFVWSFIQSFAYLHDRQLMCTLSEWYTTFHQPGLWLFTTVFV